MKTNVSISLNETERSILADFIDNKKTKRLATRAEIVALARSSIERVLIAETDQVVEAIHKINSGTRSDETNEAETIDPEDAEHLAGKSPGHVRGWNQVKRADQVRHTSALVQSAARAFGKGA